MKIYLVLLVLVFSGCSYKQQTDVKISNMSGEPISNINFIYDSEGDDGERFFETIEPNSTESFTCTISESSLGGYSSTFFCNYTFQEIQYNIAEENQTFENNNKLSIIITGDDYILEVK